jgi:hypothetical protein
MKKAKVIFAIIWGASVLVLLIIALITKLVSVDPFMVVKNFGPISKVEMSTYYEPREDKESITITDSKILDSLNASLRSLDHAITIDIAKANDVNVYMDVYKGKEKAKVRVVNSIYTGWVLIIGNLKFRDDYVFELVKRYQHK